MNLQELKRKTPAELLAFAEELEIENASSLRKQDMLFAILKQLAENDVPISGDGVLEVLPDGFGFLRSPEANYLAGPDDIYVSPSQVRRFGLRTGDTGWLDKSGRLFLGGREDHLVKVDGKRVALGEVENCLAQFPKVNAARVRVITDPLGGPMMVASVVVVGKCGAEEIIDHCAKNLAPYKVPRRIEFCESLPS